MLSGSWKSLLLKMLTIVHYFVFSVHRKLAFIGTFRDRGSESRAFPCSNSPPMSTVLNTKGVSNSNVTNTDLEKFIPNAHVIWVADGTHPIPT
jgi:hypothetical protein